MHRFTQLTFFSLILISAPLVAQELEISLNLSKDEGKEIAKIEFEETFEVIIKNLTDAEIRLPNENSSAGISALSFNVRNQETGATYNVHRKPNKEFREEPVSLAAGESLSIFVGFSYDQWNALRWRNLPTPNFDDNLEIVANYHVTPSGCKQEYWTGKVESKAIPFRFVFQRAKQPQQYLWNGFPNAALKLLKSSPERINETDEDSRTALHVAARFNHVEVVEWLIENKADVNKKAYNGFTPLYMAHMSANPKIYKLLLEAGANPNSKDAFGSTPLRTVVSRLVDPAQANNAKHIEKWDAILDVFIEQGVKLDLLSAIQLGKEDLVKEMLQQSPDMLDPYVGNQKPLRTAAQYGRVETAKFLIEEFPDKVDVNNFAGENGYPVAKSALKHFEVLELLIQNGADLEKRITWQGMRTGIWLIGDDATLLHFAARDGTPATIKLLLSRGVDPFATSKTYAEEDLGQTALEVAVLFGKTQNFLTLINHPTFQLADADIKLKILEKCFLHACRGVFSMTDSKARVKVLESVLKNGGGSFVEKDRQKYVRLITRQINPRQEIEVEIKELIQLLVDAGAEMDFFSAVALRDGETVNQMLKDDSSLCEARREDGYPAVHFAVSRGDLEMVKKFLDAGCNIELKNHSKNSGHFGGRMLHVAAFWNQAEAAKYLIESGAEVNVIAKEQTTPLHVAARTGAYDVAKLLLEGGAKVNAEDLQGRTPRDIATNPKVKQLLSDWIAKDN